MRIKALIADDHPIFLAGIKSIFKQPAFSFIEVIGTATSGSEACNETKKLKPDLLIIDMNMPEMDGPEVISRLRKDQIPTRILVLSMYNQPRLIRKAFQAGADAYLLKDKAPEELEKALKAIKNGETYFGKGVHLNEPGRCRQLKRERTYDRSDQFINQHLLTKRELEILQLISEALNNKEIAKRLFISDQTVGVHRKNIMRKLGATNAAGLIKAAHDHALI